MLFFGIDKILKILNPFMSFYESFRASNPTFDEGMVGVELLSGSLWCEGGALSGLSNFISNWYGVIYDLAWQSLVSLFVGFLLLGLVMFKKMDRGSAIKKLIVRVIFIGLGLPLIGSMYTGVLDK